MTLRKFILGIDPGTTQTAYCLCTIKEDSAEGSKPMSIQSFAKIDNEEMLKVLHSTLEDVEKQDAELTIAIEHLESYGTAVGKSTFETAYFIGRLQEIAFTYSLSNVNIQVDRIYRHEEKMRICHSMKANDATIKQALVDIFADHPEKNHGKGTKAEPDYFYGMKADCWSAFAICYTEMDKMKGLPY